MLKKDLSLNKVEWECIWMSRVRNIGFYWSVWSVSLRSLEIFIGFYEWLKGCVNNISAKWQPVCALRADLKRIKWIRRCNAEGLVSIYVYIIRRPNGRLMYWSYCIRSVPLSTLKKNIFQLFHNRVYHRIQRPNNSK